MIAWEPVNGEWHLTRTLSDPTALCGVVVAVGMSRDPHKIDDHGGTRCKSCWSEWKMRTAASLARQDQHEAAKGTE